MTNETINLLVANFFRQFMMKIICVDGAQNVTLENLEPRNVKMAVAQHIEEVAPEFNNEMFYAMMTRCYKADEAEAALRTFVAQYVTDNGHEPTMMELLPFACRTEDCYNTLIDAYRQHFMAMMDGKLLSD